MQGRFFHGKCYVGISESRQIGVVGSSNFTYGGLWGNRELNMYTKDGNAVKELHEWFLSQWNQSEGYKERSYQH